MCTTPIQPELIAAFDNERLGLSANVHQLPDSKDYEVSVVDAFSGDVVVSRSFTSKELALQIAENLIDIHGPVIQEL